MRFAARNSCSDQFAADFLRLKHVTLVKIALISFFSRKDKVKTLCSVFLFLFFFTTLVFLFAIVFGCEEKRGPFWKENIYLS